MLESILNEMRAQPDVQPFMFPVNAKSVPDYYNIVARPMDLQTMRENLRQKKYHTREDFLCDVNQIVENSTLYNGEHNRSFRLPLVLMNEIVCFAAGAKSQLTVAAKNMLQVCVNRLAEKEEKLMKLEKMINPLLDDDDQVALSFILTNIVNKLKVMSESWPFMKPVNKKAVKDYYEVVKHPMDLETISNNVKGKTESRYHERLCVSKICTWRYKLKKIEGEMKFKLVCFIPSISPNSTSDIPLRLFSTNLERIRSWTYENSRN